MAREMEPLLAEREQKEEEVRELLELAERLEGLTRNVGMHAGGVLIAPGKLTDFCPLYSAEGTDSVRQPVRQGRRGGGRPGQVRLPRPDHADHPRLDASASSTRARAQRGERSTRDDCRWTIPRPTAIFASANTTAVFQFESRGMRDLLKKAQARPLRGHHRAGGAVPPGPDGADPRVHRAQARQAARRLSRSAPASRSSARPTASWCTRSR